MQWFTNIILSLIIVTRLIANKETNNIVFFWIIVFLFADKQDMIIQRRNDKCSSKVNTWILVTFDMISTISKQSFKLHFFNDFESMKTRIESNRIESKSSRNRIDIDSILRWQKPNRIESLRDVLDVRILQKFDTIWLIQNFYMNKLIKNYVINTEYKTTTFLFYQSLMSYIDDVNQKKVHISRQKVKLICYFAIIIRSNIIKAAFELTRHFINSDLKHLKTADHCIKYLHVIKFLIIRYSNSKDEKLNNQISSSNKEKSNKKMSSTSNSKLNKKTSSNNENNDKQIFKNTADVLSANDLDRKNAEKYIFKLFDDMIDWAVKKQFIVSIFIIETKFFSMLHIDKKLIWWIHLFQKLKFNLNQKIIIYNDNLQIIHLFISKILKTETKLRHVDIAQCWLRQSIQSDYFSMNYLFIAKIITNKWTKILSSQKHREFINQLRLVDVKHLIKATECKTFECDKK